MVKRCFTESGVSGLFGMDNKYVSGVITHLAMMNVGDELTTSVGKVIKIDNESFRIKIDGDVLEQGADGLFSSRESGDVVSDLFD